MGTTGIAPDNELEQRYIRYKDVIKELTIMNDIFMRNVLKKRECAEYILRIIMEMKNLQVLDYTVQKDYKNLEIQQESEGASPKRARYHSGLLDMNTLNPGQDYEELPESYVIFITRDDVPGKGLPIYHADRVIEETGDMFGDGAHIIYVNSSIQNEDTDLGRLMHDLHCKNADEMYSEILSKRVSELKETEGETGSMCEALEELMKEMRQECEINERRKTAKALFQRGMSIKEIAEVISEKEATVESWLEAAGR